MPVRAGIQELSVKGETIVHEGIYKLELKGGAGSALGVIVLIGGRVVGTDGGVDYDGTYTLTGLGQVQASIRCTPRADACLVTGEGPQPAPFDVTETFPARGSKRIKVLAWQFCSPVDVDISYMRPLS
jgi:hypothetical protein